MDIDSARLTQYAAASLPVLREHQTRKMSDEAELAAQAVRNSADLIEFGHDASRSSRGAKALLLDVLA